MSPIRRSQRVQFQGGSGHLLAGIVDAPVDPPRGWAIFTHCFTCTKDIKLIVRISRGLAEHGFAVLRYDLTGLGGSQGNFAETNFSTNQADLLSAVDFLSRQFQPPDFLVGHSFGGAVSLSLAEHLPSIRGVVSLAAPSDTHHLAGLLERMNPNIRIAGSGTVTIGGVTHQIHRQMLDNFLQTQLPASVAGLTKPALLMHSPDDETLSYDHALRLYNLLTQRSDQGIPAAPTTLVCLAAMDHLFTRHNADLTMVTAYIAAWFERQLVAGPASVAGPAIGSVPNTSD